LTSSSSTTTGYIMPWVSNYVLCGLTPVNHKWKWDGNRGDLGNGTGSVIMKCKRCGKKAYCNEVLKEDYRW
jgi:hypothetical protein